MKRNTEAAGPVSPTGNPSLAKIAPDEAAAVTAGILGSTIERVDDVSSYAFNQVFVVHYTSGVSFLKIANDGDLRREVGVLELLSTSPVPVPVVEHADFSCRELPRPFALLRDAGGRPLQGDEPHFATAGIELRALHEIHIEGFGLLTSSSGGLRGEDVDWWSTIDRSLRLLPAVVAGGFISARAIETAVEALRDHRELVSLSSPGRLVHGDLHPRHILWADGRIAGLIDWGDAATGDPLYDFGRILQVGLLERDLAYGHRLADNLLRYYGSAPWLAVQPRTRIVLYAMAYILRAVTKGGPPARGRSVVGSRRSRSHWWTAQEAALLALAKAVRN